MKKFHRQRGQRRSFIKTLASNLILKERVVTTEARAKAIRPVVERLITIARRQRLADLRLLLARLPKRAAEKLYFQFFSRYQGRPGGYLRIVKQSRARKRDGGRTAVIEFV